MNKRRTTGLLQAMLHALLLCSFSLASAQVIERSAENFAANPVLPIAPARPDAAASAQAPVTPLTPTTSTMPTLFALRKDEAIHEGLQAWARAGGWELIWYPALSWKTLRGAEFRRHAEVTAAVSEVIDILRDEGKPLRLRISEGNQVMEVLSNEVLND
jgi:hypothetical protein